MPLSWFQFCAYPWAGGTNGLEMGSVWGFAKKFLSLVRAKKAGRAKGDFVLFFVFCRPFTLFPLLLLHSKILFSILSLLPDYPPAPKVFLSLSSCKETPKMGSICLQRALSLNSNWKDILWLEASVCTSLQGPSFHHLDTTGAPLTCGHGDCKLNATVRSLSLAS